MKDYEERNVEIYFADTRGDTYRDSNKPRSAELHDDDVIEKSPECLSKQGIFCSR